MGSARIMLNGINHFVRASLVKCVGLTHVIQKLLMQYYTALSCGALRKLPKRFQHLTETPPSVEKLTIVSKFKITFAIPVMKLVQELPKVSYKSTFNALLESLIMVVHVYLVLDYS